MSEAFQETEQSEEERVYVKKISLPTTEEGTIDWDAASDKHKKAFIQAIKADPNGILQNIQEEAKNPEEGGIADVTVVAGANLILGIEGVAFSLVGRRFVPVLSNLHPIVAIKACTVTAEEMEPVMVPAKRIVARYMPTGWTKYQDFIVVGEHLLKLSAEKFHACVKLAIEIEYQLKNPQAQGKPNGRVTTIDAEPMK